MRYKSDRFSRVIAGTAHWIKVVFIYFFIKYLADLRHSSCQFFKVIWWLIPLLENLPQDGPVWCSCSELLPQQLSRVSMGRLCCLQSISQNSAWRCCHHFWKPLLSTCSVIFKFPQRLTNVFLFNPKTSCQSFNVHHLCSRQFFHFVGQSEMWLFLSNSAMKSSILNSLLAAEGTLLFHSCYFVQLPVGHKLQALRSFSSCTVVHLGLVHLLLLVFGPACSLKGVVRSFLGVLTLNSLPLQVQQLDSVVSIESSFFLFFSFFEPVNKWQTANASDTEPS